MDYARALRSSTEWIAGSGYEIALKPVGFVVDFKYMNMQHPPPPQINALASYEWKNGK